MTSHQITINYIVALYTCKIQRAIITYMLALAPAKGEKSMFKQIYIMDST